MGTAFARYTRMTRLHVFVVTLLALVGVACTAVPEPPSWHAAVNLSALPDDEAAVFEAALADWHKAKPEIDAHRDDKAPNAFPVVHGDPGDGYLAFEEATQIAMLPCDTTTPEGFDVCKQIALHELGHFFGAKHVCDEHAVMYYSTASNAHELTATDVQELNRTMGGEHPSECHNP
jgi:hypothetical protein